MKKHGGAGQNMAMVSLLHRGGKVRSFHVPRVDKATVAKIATDNVYREAACIPM
ncbi:MAG TPA: hypothetical protein VGH23_13900 [Rhizomicrobium sp.]|jgi:hypothetical protein